MAASLASAAAVAEIGAAADEQIAMWLEDRRQGRVHERARAVMDEIGYTILSCPRSGKNSVILEVIPNGMQGGRILKVCCDFREEQIGECETSKTMSLEGIGPKVFFAQRRPLYSKVDESYIIMEKLELTLEKCPTRLWNDPMLFRTISLCAGRHRDLKPDNVARSGFKWYLLDWGAATMYGWSRVAPHPNDVNFDFLCLWYVGRYYSQIAFEHLTRLSDHVNAVYDLVHIDDDHYGRPFFQVIHRGEPSVLLYPQFPT